MYTIFQKPNQTWVVKIYSPVNKLVKAYEFKRYIECLEVVQLLQLHLNENDKANKPRTFKKAV